MLTVNNITKSFDIERGFFRRKTGSVAALAGVSFTLADGRVLGVIGESGSGKTTLGRIICGLEKPDGGQVLIDGAAVSSLKRKERAAAIQMIFQDPFASLNPRLTVGAALLEAVPPEHRREAFKRIAEMLTTLGLDQSVMTAYPHQFSGGQRQRIAIARALLREPRIIVADEPLSSLDLTIQSQMLELFRQLKARFNLMLVFITHDISAAAALADNIIVMKEGRIVEEGKSADLLQHPATEYARKLIAAVPLIRK